MCLLQRLLLACYCTYQLLFTACVCQKNCITAQSMVFGTLASLLVLFVVPKSARSLAETEQFTGPQPTPSPPPKPHELSTSVLTPLEYKTGPYSSLTSELQAHAHSRISVNLRPGFDFLDIMLKLLQWNEQDVSQMWIRPAAHLDQASYDIHTPLGLETAVQDLLRKVWDLRMTYTVASFGSMSHQQHTVWQHDSFIGMMGPC